MGKSDHCAVFNCSNDRRYPDKYVIKEHITKWDGSNKMKFFSAKNENEMKIWSQKIYREVIDKDGKKRDSTVTKYTKVCSNHFEYGRPTQVSPHPTLYMRGYDEQIKKRKDPKIRFPLPQKQRSCPKLPVPTLPALNLPTTPGKDKDENQLETTVGSSSSLLFTTPPPTDFSIVDVTSLPPLPPPPSPISENMANAKVINIPHLSWDYVKEHPRIVKVYTGCHTPQAFEFIVGRVKPKHVKIQYFKGSGSGYKNYQSSPSKPMCRRKPGPSRKMSLEDEILLVLMRIRLDAPVEDLAFRFKISPSYVSKIFTTLVIVLAAELKPLIYWPTPDETLSYKHHHFSGTLHKVEGIGDCTEQSIQRSTNTAAQYQTYSTYKSKNTLKKLIVCTKSGSISFISASYAGSSSDRFITENCNVVNKFTPGFVALFDKGFNVQDLFLHQNVRAIIPPFVRSKRQFTPSEVQLAKRIARARIHI